MFLSLFLKGEPSAAQPCFRAPAACLNPHAICGRLLLIAKLCAFLLLFLLFTERAGPDLPEKDDPFVRFRSVLLLNSGLFKDSLPLIKQYLAR